MDEIEPSAIPETILKDKRAPYLYFIAVIALAIIGVLSVLSIVFLAWNGKASAEVLAVISGGFFTVVGALSMMLGGERQ